MVIIYIITYGDNICDKSFHCDWSVRYTTKLYFPLLYSRGRDLIIFFRDAIVFGEVIITVRELSGNNLISPSLIILLQTFLCCLKVNQSSGVPLDQVLDQALSLLWMELWREPRISSLSIKVFLCYENTLLRISPSLERRESSTLVSQFKVLSTHISFEDWLCSLNGSEK